MRSIHLCCIVCTPHVPRACSLLRRSQRIRGGVRHGIPSLLNPTRPLLISTATQGAHWTECTACAPRTPRASPPPLPPAVRRTRPASRIAYDALPRHRWSPRLAPLACAVRRHHKLNGQSCGARAGGASTSWICPVAFKDARAVSRGATTTGASFDHRRRHRRAAMVACHVLEVFVGRHR